MPDSKQDRAGGRPNWTRFLWIMLAVLILNWLLASALISAARPTVSYTFFLTATGSTGWRTPSWTGKPSTRTRRTPRPASGPAPSPPRSPAARPPEWRCQTADAAAGSHRHSGHHRSVSIPTPTPTAHPPAMSDG